MAEMCTCVVCQKVFDFEVEGFVQVNGRGTMEMLCSEVCGFEVIKRYANIIESGLKELSKKKPLFDIFNPN